MLDQLTTIVRSNQNAVMFRIGNAQTAVYTIFDLNENQNTYTGTLGATKQAWNRRYKNSRQFVSGNGVNHRYMNQS